MFENVVAMRVNDKRDISRFLEVREHRAGPCMQGRAVLHLHPTTSPWLTRCTHTHPWEQKTCTDPPRNLFPHLSGCSVTRL